MDRRLIGMAVAIVVIIILAIIIYRCKYRSEEEREHHRNKLIWGIILTIIVVGFLVYYFVPKEGGLLGYGEAKPEGGAGDADDYAGSQDRPEGGVFQKLQQTAADNAVRRKASDKAYKDYLAAHPGDKGGARQAAKYAESQVKSLQGNAKLSAKEAESKGRQAAAGKIAALTGADQKGK